MSPNKIPQIKNIPCDNCGNDEFRFLFSKKSSHNDIFSIVECKSCKLVQVNPQPDLDFVTSYYENHYFSKRSDRGYDNYFSIDLKQQINKVYNMNLKDLDFAKYENYLKSQKKIWTALDVGCAAGYFVEYMNQRGWQAQGIELSKDAASFGIDHLGLKILIDDFLVCKQLKKNSFDFVSFWASIEHMHSPRRVLERCHDLLRPGGRLILSTCRWGVLAKIQGVGWRYMNVPEHLYFFTLPGLIEMANDIGFSLFKSITYGSGMTAKMGSGWMYNISKKVADPVVKYTGQGDMMALHLVRND